jgi:hypothetical protein
MWKFGRREATVPPEAWTVATGEYDGRPMLLRLNSALKSFAGDRRFPFHVGCTIPFTAPDDRGFPSVEESPELAKIEEGLISAFSANGNAIPAAVITTNGMRELVFYAAAHEPVVRDYERLRDRYVHELQMEVKRDPAWEVYRALSGA